MPTSKPELQAFLGLANYYAKLIKHFAWHAHPLYQLLHKDISCTGPSNMILLCKSWKMPHVKRLFGATKLIPAFHHTNGCKWIYGGWITHIGARCIEQPVCYYSKSFTNAQQRYPTHGCELYTIVEACQWWRPYIEDMCCKVFTDHEPLKHIFTQCNLNKWQCWWVEKLVDTR